MKPIAIVHHFGADLTFSEVVRMHMEDNGWNDIAYHDVITYCNRTHKAVLRPGRSMFRTGAHDRGQNDCYGVALQGDWRETGWHQNGYPLRYAFQRQWRILLQLLDDRRRQGLITSVQGHMEFEPATSETECPGFDPERIRRALGWGWGSLPKREILPVSDVMKLTS